MMTSQVLMHQHHVVRCVQEDTNMLRTRFAED